MRQISIIIGTIILALSFVAEARNRLEVVKEINALLMTLRNGPGDQPAQRRLASQAEKGDATHKRFLKTVSEAAEENLISPTEEQNLKQAGSWSGRPEISNEQSAAEGSTVLMEAQLKAFKEIGIVRLENRDIPNANTPSLVPEQRHLSKYDCLLPSGNNQCSTSSENLKAKSERTTH
jgi:hypothetical protein